MGDRRITSLCTVTSHGIFEDWLTIIDSSRAGINDPRQPIIAYDPLSYTSQSYNKKGLVGAMRYDVAWHRFVSISVIIAVTSIDFVLLQRFRFLCTFYVYCIILILKEWLSK
jgi:hypothetical protein